MTLLAAEISGAASVVRNGSSSVSACDPPDETAWADVSTVCSSGLARAISRVCSAADRIARTRSSAVSSSWATTARNRSSSRSTIAWPSPGLVPYSL